MPKQRIKSPSDSSRVVIRFEAVFLDHLRQQAQRNGTTLAEFIRLTLHRGLLATDVDLLDEKIQSLTEKLDITAPKLSASAMSENALHALYTMCEVMYGTVNNRDVKEWRDASEKGRIKARRELGLLK